MTESSNWIRGLPAVVVGTLALLLAAYGYWILPSRLPGQYQGYLAKSSSAYEASTAALSLAALRNASATAADLGVIYKRLVVLENGNPQRIWQQADFYARHAAFLQRYTKSATLSLSEDDQHTISEELPKYVSLATETLQRLAEGDSEFRFKSKFRLGMQEFESGMRQYGVANADKNRAALHQLIDDYIQTKGSVRDEQALLSSSELDQAYQLVTQFAIEAAWQNTSGVSLRCDSERLALAKDTIQIATTSGIDTLRSLEWTAIRGLIIAYGLEQVPSESTDKAARATEDSAIETWQRRLSELQLAAVTGAWQDLAFELSRGNGADDPAVIMGLARTICRLACSPMARKNPAWCKKFDVGLLLVAQIAPHSPEFSELIWECAKSRSGHTSERHENASPVAPLILETMATGQSAWLKHSVFALASAVDGKLDVARTHLQLIQRARADLSIVARVSLWQAQQTQSVRSAPTVESVEETGATSDTREGQAELENLAKLMELVAELEPNSGLNWFVLGSLQHRNENFDAAIVSLERAQKLLGDATAIRDLIKVAKKELGVRS